MGRTHGEEHEALCPVGGNPDWIKMSVKSPAQEGSCCRDKMTTAPIPCAPAWEEEGW